MESLDSQRRVRVFALSDIHVDNRDNVLWLRQLSSTDFTADTLILAGDVSDHLDKIEATLRCLRNSFERVFFVPGNHELWIRRMESADSIAKFWRVVKLCDSLGVWTSPARIGGTGSSNSVWIVPLFAWYTRPEEGGDTLFTPKKGEDPTLAMWGDNYFTRWPPLGTGITVAEYFLRLNERHLSRRYDAPIISFSHFLPRSDLIFDTKEEYEAATVPFKDPNPSFNFSRVAGCAGLDKQIRRLGSAIHVYGHQHRNRNRLIDGVRYVSHCLGYPHEKEEGQIHGLEAGPKLIWDSANGPTTGSWA